MATGGRPDHLGPAITRAKEGDASAMHFLYVRYVDDVHRYVHSIVRNPHDAEDVTQALFAKLITTIWRYEEREVPFAAWILRVARNAALDHMRKQRHIPCEEVHAPHEHDEQVRVERTHSLRAAFERVPEEQRVVLLMRYIRGMSTREIAASLGKSEGAVHGLHHRGRRTVRRTLLELESGPVTASL
jgi:RNA polymerase sigma-70 factor (ECF subfamily)